MLIIFDVEGVLLNAEYLPILAQVFGPAKEKEIWDITKQGIRGDIDWEEGLIRRVHALRGTSYQDAKMIGENLEIMPGAKDLCLTLKNAGWKMVAISGGFTIITDRLKKELGIDLIFSNELIFKNGILDDIDLKVTSDKSLVVKPIIKQLDIKKEEIVVVVDGANDLKLFEIAGYTVGFCPVEIVKNRADDVIEIRNLLLLKNLLEKRFGNWILKTNQKNEKVEEMKNKINNLY
jgi:phosphoserine phosphatase